MLVALRRASNGSSPSDSWMCFKNSGSFTTHLLARGVHAVGPLDVDVLGVGGALHDEAKAGARVLAHELVHDAIGLERVLDRDPERRALLRIEGGRLQDRKSTRLNS